MANLVDALPPQVLNLEELYGLIIARIKEDAPDPVLYDLGCGKCPAKGFVGVDLYAKADVKHDLETGDWSFTPDDSVSMFYSSHYFEHVSDVQRFMAKAWEKMKDGAYFLITTPFGNSPRAWLDPDHKRPIFPELYWRFNKAWRDKNDVDHYYPYPDTDFEIVEIYPVWNPDFANLNDEAKAYHLKHTFAAADDLTVLLRAVKRKDA